MKKGVFRTNEWGGGLLGGARGKREGLGGIVAANQSGGDGKREKGERAEQKDISA